MPEPKTTTLKQPGPAAVMGALGQRPDWQVVNVADGAPDKWRDVGETLPCGVEVRDCYHAVEPLGAALAAAYGEGTPACQERFETLRTTLRDAPQGADKVLRALRRLRTRSPRRQALQKALAYFRAPRCRMH